MGCDRGGNRGGDRGGGVLIFLLICGIIGGGTLTLCGC